jgi:ComEC/Rec2-related protein
MNIFYKRPLSLILCIGLGGFFLFSFLPSALLRVILCILAFLPCIISLYLRKPNHNPKLLKIITVILLLSYLLSFLYFDLGFKIYEKYDGEVEITGVVEEVSSSSSYTMRLLVKVERINGKRANYHVYAYPTKAESAGIIEGTRLSFFSTLGGFSDESMTYNISNGINAYANDIRDIKIIEYTSGGIMARLRHYRSYLARRLTMLTDGDTGAILSALLLGERDLLPSSLRLAFKRIGISHILALSGMHLAILSLGIGWLLTKLQIRKKLRVTIIALFILLYMALTGFSVSVCRAGIMIILAYGLFLLERTKDSMTSLTVAVTIICIFTPYAVYDISLALSALATFGIIAFAENITKNNSKNNILKYISMSFMTSIFAISATLYFSVFTFGGISILSLPATLIFSILAEVIMYIGCIVMIIGGIIPIGFIVTPFTKLLTFLAELMASFKFAYVSSNFTVVKVAIIAYTILFYFFIIAKLKNKKIWMKILIVSFAVVLIIPTTLTVRENHRETIAYYGQYKSDMMLVRSENEVCLISSSQYSKSTAYNALDLLEDANVTRLDKYYLTHYSWSIDDELDVLLYNVSVDKIYLPYPRNDDEETILKVIRSATEDSNAEIVLFKEYETVKVGEYTLNLIQSVPYGDTSMNAFVLAKGNTVYTYISSGLITADKNNEYVKYLSLSDYVILGDHGKKLKTKVYINGKYEDLDALIMHSDNIFLNQDNMSYLIEKGCEIYSHPKEIIYFK